MPLPIAILLPLLRAYWKPVAVGLAALAVSGILVSGCHHYKRLVAANAVLAAENAAQSQALERWQEAETERARLAAEAARVADAARGETRKLDEAFASTNDPDALLERRDIDRLFGLLAEATAVGP